MCGAMLEADCHLLGVDGSECGRLTHCSVLHCFSAHLYCLPAHTACLHCLPSQVMTLAENILAKHHQTHRAISAEGASAPAPGGGMYRAVGTAASSAGDVMLQASVSTDELLPQGSAAAFSTDLRL